MKKIILFLCVAILAGHLYGESRTVLPSLSVYTDIRSFDTHWEIKRIVAGTTPGIRQYLQESQQPWYASGQWGAYMWYGTNSDWLSTNNVIIPGSFDTNYPYIDYSCTVSSFATQGTYYGGFIMTNASQLVEWGFGIVYVTNSGGVGGGSVLFTNNSVYQTWALEGHLAYVSQTNGSAYVLQSTGNVDAINRRLHDSTTRRSIDWENRQLKEQNGSTSVAWEDENLLDGENISLDWGERKLHTSGENEILNWEYGYLASNGTNHMTLHWLLRNLYASDGSSPVLNWDGPISVSTNIVLTSSNMWELGSQATPLKSVWVAGTKSVTGIWEDVNNITNQQIFLGGRLTSWTTNGVER